MNQIDYDRLPNWNPAAITFDIIDVKMKLEKPVIFKNCAHFRQSITLADALSNGNQIRCSCGQTSKSLSDLCKDLRWQVQQEFHPSVEQVQIIQGILTHKYNRKKRYTDLIQSAHGQIPEFLQNMKNRFHKSNSISTIIQQQQPKQDRVTFWAYCLLDKVKITTPVRFLQCKHPECYELTSLLAYQDQLTKQEGNQKLIFECCHPGCSTSIKISSVEELISQLGLDVDLLEIINKSLPCQFKFVYLPQQKQFDLESLNATDTFINKIYQTHFTEKEKKDCSLNVFINQVQSQIVTIMQQEINPAQEKILKQEMFKEKVINLIDPLTKECIEFPVRCTKCTQYDKCVDVRSFAACHILAKIRKATTNKCPLCQNEYNCLKVLNQNIVYFDQNLLSKMFKDMQFTQMNQFRYEGKHYMREQFYYRQKVDRDEYVKELKIKNNTTFSEFSTSCCCDPNQQIEFPLSIMDCPTKNVIDFETFYKKMVEINFEIEEKGLILCQCISCNANPIKSYMKSIYFHEALSEAIKEYKKEQKQKNIKVKVFKYDFNDRKVIIKLNDKKNNQDIDIMKSVKIQKGFVDLMDDAEYQECFKPKLLGGHLFQVTGMQQTLIEGLVIVHDKDGAKANIEENMKNVNKNANQNLKKFKFEVTGIQVDLDPEFNNLNKGQFVVQK